MSIAFPDPPGISPFPPRSTLLPTRDEATLLPDTAAKNLTAEPLIATADGDTETLLRWLDDYARIASLAAARGGIDWTTPLRVRRGGAP